MLLLLLLMLANINSACLLLRSFLGKQEVS